MAAHAIPAATSLENQTSSRCSGIRASVPRILVLRRIAVTLLVFALLGGTAAAFALTEALKLEGRAVLRLRVTEAFAPDASCGPRRAAFAFTLRRSGPIDAAVVDAEGRPVRTLASGLAREARRIRLRWDGTRDDGGRAAEGEYRLRLYLHREDRTVTTPNAVRLESAREAAARCPRA